MKAKTYIAAAGVLAACLSAPAMAKEPSSHQKKLAALASDEAAFKQAQAQQGRIESRQTVSGAGRERVDAFTRLCRIKPVMTDPEIESCKRAYRL